MTTHTHTVRLDEEEAAALREHATASGLSAHATHRAILRDRLGVVRQPQAPAPAAAPPTPQAPPIAAMPMGGLGDLAQLVTLMRAMQPPQPDLTPVLAALVSAQRGPDLAGLAALMQTLRPEPTPSPWPAVLGAVLPVAAPVLETYLQARAEAAGTSSIGGALAQIGALVAGRFAESDDQEEEEDEQASDGDQAPPVRQVTPQ